LVSANGPFATALAQGRSTATGRHFNLAVVLDGELTPDGRSMGRAVAESTFHHFADYNWDLDRGAPSFVTEPPGTEIKADPSRLAIFKDYVRNLATCLQPTTSTGAVLAASGVLLLTRPQPTTDYLGVGLGLARRGMLGELHPAQSHSRATLHRRRGNGGGWRGVGSGVRADRVRRADRPPADGSRAGLRRHRRCSRVGFPVRRRRPRAAPRVHTFLRHIDERQPCVRRSIGAAVLAESLGTLEWIAIILIVAANVGVVLTTRAGVVALNVPYRSKNLENVAR